MRLAVDVGGTFTDAVLLLPGGELRAGKVLTSVGGPESSVAEAAALVAGGSTGSVDVLVHATTLGSNMLLGQAGLEKPRAVLITNRGFEDVLEIGRQIRPSLYDLFFSKPRPLIPRRERIGVRGRIGPSGEELEPLSEEELRAVARSFCGKAEVFIVSFLHCYANRSHEEEAKRIVSEECPGAWVVASCEVDPRPGEYERTSTAVISGLLKPVLSAYLARMREKLAARGFRGEILVMSSWGGVASLEEAVESPAAFVESGPAAGAVAAAALSREAGYGDCLSFDMGGTTAKAALVSGGEPALSDEFEVGGRAHAGRLIRGSGYPLRLPHVDLAEVSAGGGSIAWVDAGGSLRVGPMSAGADPGPACYARGGEKPTVTDAALVLGWLPRLIAGGKLLLSAEKAREAVGRLADELGSSLEETAHDIVRVSVGEAARALRIVSVERGVDPRELALVAFGGAGPMFAALLAGEMGARAAVIPRLPGVFSALGLLLSDYKHELSYGVAKRVEELDGGALSRIVGDLEEKALRILARERVSEDNVVFSVFVEARYWGQAYSVMVPYAGSLEETVRRFHGLYKSRYGYSSEEEDVEIISVRLTAVGRTEKPSLRIGEAAPYEPPETGRREAFFGEWVEARVHRREALRPGARIDGPAVIEEAGSTTVLPPGFEAMVDEYGSLVVKSAR